MLIPKCTVSPTLAPPLVVWWVNGSEKFALWNYDPTVNVYTAVVPGLDVGRATIVPGPNTIFSIQGTPVLQGANDGSVQMAEVSEYAPLTTPTQAQLQFVIANRKVATVSVGGLNVSTVSEGSPAGGNVFQIYANGSLAAVLSAAGLTATEIEEVL